MSTTTQLPHWQLESIYPALDGDAYRADRARLAREIGELADLVERHDLGRGAEVGADATPDVAERAIERIDAISELLVTLVAYLNGFIATDAFDDAAQAERSSLEPLVTRLIALDSRVTAWFGTLDLGALSERSAAARERRYALERSAVDAAHLMSDDLEELAAALNPSGGGAWARLHGNLTSRHAVRADLPGREAGREYGLAELKNLQSEADPALREAAYRAERELLGRDAVSFAAAMNGVKGEVGELSRRRGWAHPLDASLHANGIDRASLDAMQTACREAFPVFRRYLRAKARALGKEALDWWDLRAPLAAADDAGYDWERAKAFVLEQFAGYAPDLAAYARRAFEAGWVDVPPRRGKRSGAFCMGVPARAESRIMLNFGGTLDDVFTLAHELGHGYHNACMYDAGRDAWQRQTPMTLAETASIFCETIVTNAMLARADDAARLAILEQDLQGATQLVLDIDSRFRFERAVFDRRPDRELSIDEFRGIMLDAQAATYGDALGAEGRHADMWAQKGHYYSTGRSFYNYPYTFGYLFGLGLYAEYDRAPDTFPGRYRELLASTGMADAATLAERFGIDIRDPDFWRASLTVAAERVEAFEELAAELA